MKSNKKLISEDLKRFRDILGYSIEGKKRLNEAPEDEEGDDFDFAKDVPAADEEEGGEDFDFGDEGSPEDEGSGDFDFGDEGSPEDEGEVDEFGTADEFSAADDIETDEEVEEIDVTDIVTKSEQAKENSETAVQVSQETNSYIKDMSDKLTNLEAQLVKMDNIMAKVSKLEADVKTPEEKLELRSLDSYPFNMKLTDYWTDKAKDPNSNYEITDGEDKVFELTKDDLEDYNDSDIINSFNPGID